MFQVLLVSTTHRAFPLFHPCSKFCWLVLHTEHFHSFTLCSKFCWLVLHTEHFHSFTLVPSLLVSTYIHRAFPLFHPCSKFCWLVHTQSISTLSPLFQVLLVSTHKAFPLFHSCSKFCWLVLHRAFPLFHPCSKFCWLVLHTQSISTLSPLFQVLLVSTTHRAFPLFHSCSKFCWLVCTHTEHFHSFTLVPSSAG